MEMLAEWWRLSGENTQEAIYLARLGSVETKLISDFGNWYGGKECSGDTLEEARGIDHALGERIRHDLDFSWK